MKMMNGAKCLEKPCRRGDGRGMVGGACASRRPACFLGSRSKVFT